ncbi:DUF3833 domain-containing protein [Herbaspirillum sp. alder98]|uniref:DUF3833 domain-containing protein n=1 Tax=Herbaspirillum sp. alder98 TaxID=2913096 RepID=UPI001CD88F75|nr:DUF3833 domain-containing protein [Herbaspirillum sp. alder98]MCA1324151.1 DUF3833 domain-containing protein [Herbaspirillum sp. alder98]
MHRWIRRLVALCLPWLLAACASQDIGDYAQARPQFDPAQFFAGRTQAWGIFQKRDGSVARRFHVVIDGRVEGRKLTLDERFRYDDGETQQRVWSLERQDDGTWRGTAGDVKGVAIGEVAGNTLHWRYTLVLPVKDTTYDMRMDDWMYLIDDKTMINRTSMQKFGIEVGQVSLFFRKD